MTPTHTTRQTRRPVAVAIGAVLATAAVTPVARAAEPVLENTHYRVSFEHVEQDLGGCLDLAFPLHHDGETNARIQQRTRGVSGPAYSSLRYTTHDVYTNLTTGESFTAHEVVRNADSRVVENADGTLTITYSAMETTTVHTPSGALFGVDSGRVTGTVRLDPADPADPEDDIVISEELSDATGVSRLGGFDLCSVAETLLG
jgi:hypothetical protein